MPGKRLQNYTAEAHDIYLGKNRRLADPIFFPAPGLIDPMLMREIKKQLINEMESEPDGPRIVTKYTMSQWGWGNWIRYPPGGPTPKLEDYEKSMDAMAADVHETWSKIQRLVHNNEDDIRKWILGSHVGVKHGELCRLESLCVCISWTWDQTVTEFNECHKDIKKLMEPKSIESDFQIRVPDFDVYQGSPLEFIRRHMPTGVATDVSPAREQHITSYAHSFNFFDDRPVDNWPHQTEPGMDIHKELFNHRDSREFYRNSRVSLLAPHITSLNLFRPVCLASLVHCRGRQHPSVFAKFDNDMTFIGRRTNHLTGPLIQNCMVSFDTSGSGFAKGYRPRLWKGWGGQPGLGMSTEDKEEYDALWHRGQLFGASEAWIMLQSQRVTYHFLWNFLVFICNEIRLDPTVCLAPKSLLERSQILHDITTQREALETLTLKFDWLSFTLLQPFISPPTRIAPRYFGDLQSKMEIAEKHVQDLFKDPVYLFECLYELKEHHWGNIGIKSDNESPNCDHYSKYVEYYTDEQIRHMLYFDLLRGVLRRAIFEFYMWHSIHIRLKEFESLMRDKFTDYGKKDMLESDPNSDGTNMLQHPPLFLSDKRIHEYPEVAEKYLSLVVLLRYHAVFFVNEFRKRGIHAGASTLCDVAYSNGQPQEETTDRLCNIQKKHYGASNLNYSTKMRTPWFCPESCSADDKERMAILEMMDNFISQPMDCTNCGIKEAANYLQKISQAWNSQNKELVFTNLLSDTIDGLDLLSSLADHLEYLWPAMDRVGGAAVDETVRRKYFDLGSKDISINFLDYDDFDFDSKVPMKRLQRLFLFFDELQGFKKESISMGHARGDLKRFGASLLCKLIYPLNDKAGDRKASPEAISRLEEAMGVTGSEYEFSPKERPFNLDQVEAEEGKTVELINQPLGYRDVAAREREKAKERQQRRDAWSDELSDSTKSDEAANKKRRKKKQARRHKRARMRANTSGQPVPEDENRGKGQDMAMPDVGKDNLPKGWPYNPRWEESLHATLRQFQLPPIPETRSLAEPQVTAPPFSASLQPAPAGPDGRPKGIIKKREWGTLEAIYGIRGSANAAVSYAQLKAAMEALGYGETGRGGSHMSYIRHDGRWPHDVLPRGENIQLAKTHGRERAAAAKGKSMDWGRRLCERGLTFSFIKEWYMKV